MDDAAHLLLYMPDNPATHNLIDELASNPLKYACSAGRG